MMAQPVSLLLVISASLVVSIAAGVGASIPLLQRQRLAGRLPGAASFAAGVLLGEAFLDLLPDSMGHGLSSANIGGWLMAGVLIFFGIECVLRTAPRMIAATSAGNRFAVVALMDRIGDLSHHVMDGLLIGGAFLAGLPIGIVTVVAIASHEVVRKFGVTGVLLMSGMDPRRAMVIVWLNTLACPLGACVLLMLVHDPRLLSPILALVAGGAVYLACSDFLPSAWQASGINPSPGIAAGMGFGIFVIWACNAFEHLV